MMGNFIEILSEFKEFDAPLDEGDSLTQFFKVMEHFNNNSAINQNLKDEIENFFDYKWSTDKNYAFLDPRFEGIV